MIALLVPLLAAAAPHHVLDDSEIGTWAQVPLEAYEVAEIAALAGGGPWSGHGPYARSVSLDRVGDLSVGRTLTTMGADGAPVSCEITGFGLVDYAFDDGARVGREGEPDGCSSPGIWARLACGGVPGPIGLPGGKAPGTFVPSDASEAERLAALDAVRPALGAMTASAPATPLTEAKVARYEHKGRIVLLVTVEAWVGERVWGCGNGDWFVRGGLLEESPSAILDADRDGGVDVLVRGLAGDALIGVEWLRTDRSVCVCLC